MLYKIINKFNQLNQSIIITIRLSNQIIIRTKIIIKVISFVLISLILINKQTQMQIIHNNSNIYNKTNNNSHNKSHNKSHNNTNKTLVNQSAYKHNNKTKITHKT